MEHPRKSQNLAAPMGRVKDKKRSAADSAEKKDKKRRRIIDDVPEVTDHVLPVHVHHEVVNTSTAHDQSLQSQISDGTNVNGKANEDGLRMEKSRKKSKDKKRHLELQLQGGFLETAQPDKAVMDPQETVPVNSVAENCIKDDHLERDKSTEKKIKKRKRDVPKDADGLSNADAPTGELKMLAGKTASEKRKKTKRDAHTAVEGLPEVNTAVEEPQTLAGQTVVVEPRDATQKTRTKRRHKKSSKSHSTSNHHSESAPTSTQPTPAVSNEPSEAVINSQEDIHTNEAAPSAASPPPDNQQHSPNKSQRFIVFIGNLPYTATTASISAHFSKIAPTSVRLITDKSNGKSKGFAFLEFDHFDRMKSCLKLYHHSNFDDGESPARRINVELTAGGGGGKSEGRREKLAVKNDRLREQRRRRVHAEEEEKRGRKRENRVDGRENGDENRKKDGDAVSRREARKEKKRAEKAVNGDEKVAAAFTPGVVNDGEIHPSRRLQMQHVLG